jgi:hypothetical protein
MRKKLDPGDILKPLALEDTMAYRIAWADQYTDVNSFTEPTAPKNERARRRYHFAVGHEFGATVKRGNRIVESYVDDALKQNLDPFLMGIALHAYQDSWSHEGYGPETGHMFARHNGHDPDIPALNKESLDKAMEMAEATYGKLAKLAKFYGCEPLEWKAIEPEVKKLLGTQGSKDGPYRDIGVPFIIPKDEELYRREEELRSENWRKAIEQRFHAKVKFSSAGDNDKWAKDFLKAANNRIFVP